MVYNQDTLIISAPDENKEQEKFLGYKWSNRKGQEGIQIIKAGGCLYNASDRSDNNSIAGLIRNAFSDEDEFDAEDLSDYYYRLRLQDMLDFSGTTFNKSIKTTPTRVLKDIPGLTNYRLADKNFFDLSIGNRVLSDEVVENGSIPIYSANVFEEFGRIDKQNITDFSVPSILWGIDGDWMVNIMPADKPFYPTDHCGVLRIKTDDILPKYMALALQVEGEFERFSRSNRASTQRIANLIIQVPSVSEQQKIVDEIEAIDKRIADEQAIISEQSVKVKSKFVEMFGNEQRYPLKTISDVANICRGASPRPISNYLTEDIDGVNWIKIGDIAIDDTYVTHTAEKITKDGAKKSRYVKPGDFILSNSMSFGRPYILEIEGCVHDGWLIISDYQPSLNTLFFYYELRASNVQSQFTALANGTTVENLNTDLVKSVSIIIPPIELQNQFADYAQSCDKLKFEAHFHQNSYKELMFKKKMTTLE